MPKVNITLRDGSEYECIYKRKDIYEDLTKRGKVRLTQGCNTLWFTRAEVREIWDGKQVIMFSGSSF